MKTDNSDSTFIWYLIERYNFILPKGFWGHLGFFLRFPYDYYRFKKGMKYN